MDLGAYIQIGKLEHLLKENNIEIPRLRGLRLMKDEEKFTKEEIEEEASDQLEKFNSYGGRDDVLYIHARIGGGNWPYYRSEVENQPWFIEKIDDYYDSTYCDIYARITPVQGGQ